MPDDPRPRLRRRFFASLVLIGLLVGLMIGRLTAPDPVRLLRVEPGPAVLSLWFDREPELHSQDIDGAVGMLLQAEGQAQRGQLQANGSTVGWRLQKNTRGLLLGFVATRPLKAEWRGARDDEGWRLDVKVGPRE